MILPVQSSGMGSTVVCFGSIHSTLTLLLLVTSLFIISIFHIQYLFTDRILVIYRCVVERWKSVLTVPYQVIYALLEVKDGTNREVEAGIQLLGVILVNGLPPYSPDSTALKTKYVQ